MDDVILYNESWDIDKLSPYNTFFMEDGDNKIVAFFKRAIELLKNAIKNFITKIKAYFDKKLINHLRVKLRDEHWCYQHRQIKCPKWDTDSTMKMYQYVCTATDVMVKNGIISTSDTIPSIETLRKAESDINTCAVKIKEYSEKINANTVTGEWTLYDGYKALVNEADAAYDAVQLSQMVLDNLKSLEARKDSFEGSQEQYKLMCDIMGKAGSLLVNIIGTDFTKSQHKALRYGTNYGSRDAKRVLNSIKYTKESYMEGMNGMDVIFYNDDNEYPVTESAVEETDGITLDEVDAYIESMMDDLNEAMDFRSSLIQEADEDTGDAESTSDDGIESPDTVEEESLYASVKGRTPVDKAKEAEYLKKQYASVGNNKYEKVFGDKKDKIKGYLSSRNMENAKASKGEGKMHPLTVDKEGSGRKYAGTAKPYKESYVLDGSAIFGESYNHMDDAENNLPSRFAQEAYIRQLDIELDDDLTEEEFFDESYIPDFYKESSYLGAAVAGSVIGFALGSAISAGIIAINKLITDKKYGRFPKDMKAIYEIIKTDGFEASEKTKSLKKAFRNLNADLAYMLVGFGSRWKLTVDEAHEVKKLKDYVDDLYTRGWMLTKNKEKSDKRRVPERIEAFVKQGNKVLDILSKSVYKSDVVREYMS